MLRDDASLLDIAHAARRTIAFIQGVDKDGFLADIKTQSAVLDQITVIGEATKRLSPVFRQGYPEIPWRNAAGMRDRLIHGYDEVDLVLVWTAATEDSPALLAQIEPLLPPPPD
ncbi:MAG: Protein of unknown function DUF86, BT0167 group [uncultured Thermomicrobiales bacterium]|uniref:DUF86 domain-containing protein n=1 Tax=uncultured Thermomicrobiales bacterium TaxID=1645740 RepID=A0A6J4U6G1_9BACT|nr:MAG: Protein of unknown function DUF86, BT0167 group [uncultured Thermomicrobiales bacterium]